MALGDLMATRFAHSTVVVSNHLDEYLSRDDVELYRNRDNSETASTSGGGGGNVIENAITTLATVAGTTNTTTTTATTMVYFPQTIVFCELRHEAFEDSVPTGPAESGLVSKWRPRDRVRFPFSFRFRFED